MELGLNKTAEFPSSTHGLTNTINVSGSSSSETTQEKDLEISAFVFIFVLSVVGNSLVITVVKKNYFGTRKVTTNIFIAHMGVADIVATVFGIPTMITRIILKGGWYTGGSAGLALCKIIPFIIETSFAVSALTIALIAFERYLVVFYPMRKILPCSKACSVEAIMWIFATAFYAPKLAALTLAEKRGKFYCFTQKDIISPWREIEAVLFMLMLLLTLCFYVAIICKVRCNSRKHFPAKSNERQKASSQTRERLNRRVLWQSLVIIFIHYLCWFPYLFVYFTCFFTKYNLAYCTNPILTNFLVIFFGYCNAAANPFVYAILSENFRLGFKEIIRNCCFSIRQTIYPDIMASRQQRHIKDVQRLHQQPNGQPKNGLINDNARPEINLGEQNGSKKTVKIQMVTL